MMQFGVQSASAHSFVTDSESVITNNFYNYSSSSSDSSSTKERLKGSLEFDYSFMEENPALGLNLNLGGLVLFGEYQPMGTMPEGVKSMSSWGAGAGLNKRIYIFGFLYVEGRVGAAYHENSIVYENGYGDSETTSTWGYFAAPRAGLKLLDNVCVNAGYKWNFAEFKIAEEYITEYMTVGISFLF